MPIRGDGRAGFCTVLARLCIMANMARHPSPGALLHVLFDDRFIDKHAGQIVNDPIVAITELVANCWDAGATEVKIHWPTATNTAGVSISDNGVGMTKKQFELIWRTIDYDRVRAMGHDTVFFPADAGVASKRRAFGRNGRGRHASFCFGRSYVVTTWRDGARASFRVSRGTDSPFKFEEVPVTPAPGHGTIIEAEASTPWTAITPKMVRSIIGQRFLVDPHFEVFVNNDRVEFQDLPSDMTRRETITVDDIGTIELLTLDASRTSRTTQQHGIAWRVKNRLVGEPSWAGFDDQSLLDGRRTEAKRYTFIVFADVLESAVRHDWSGFDLHNPVWQKVGRVAHERIGELIIDLARARIEVIKSRVIQNSRGAWKRMPLRSREKFDSFVDEVLRRCPSLSEANLSQIAGTLARLEVSESQYSLLEQLHMLKAGELDDLNNILAMWTLKMAKIVLDTVEQRLRLIKELKRTASQKSADEVHEIMPLIANGLWMFGAEFESIEFTVNKGMTTVIRELFAKKTDDDEARVTGSRKRPDFVILPDTMLGCYSRPEYDAHHNEISPACAVIVELKAPQVPITAKERTQAETYYTELLERGVLTPSTVVYAFIVGDTVKGSFLRTTDAENYHARVMRYEELITRAENRMMKLYNKVLSAPTLEGSGLEKFVSETLDGQQDLLDLFEAATTPGVDDVPPP
jgi:hypothetical protein